ncbi:glycosyltransferase family protein [Saccharicrinis aurantiacus]|uniref:hypothetical protein n=1 Tax=Saccharicrinis aurantiacus TaxID=1849719 RepID=UPI000837B1EF|nr:hypothetical protein [Saccharicrinis aurantiacus]
MERNTESVNDITSKEMVMLECAERLNYDFELLTLIQATSSLITFSDINTTLRMVKKKVFDSAVTVIETKQCITWNN